MYFRARNGTFKRVPQIGNVNFEQSKGGMTVYYTPVISGSSKVTAFKPVRYFTYPLIHLYLIHNISILSVLFFQRENPQSPTPKTKS